MPDTTESSPFSEPVRTIHNHAAMEELRRNRVAARFLPPCYVDRKIVSVPADVVTTPPPPGAPGAAVPYDPALYVVEVTTIPIQEYSVTYKLTVAQVTAEEHEEEELKVETPAAPAESPGGAAPGGAAPGEVQHHPQHHRATTATSLVMKSAIGLALAEDLIVYSGKNAVANHPLFINQSVQSLDPNLLGDIDTGLLNIDQNGNLSVQDIRQVIAVYPVSVNPLRYAENTLNAVAQAFSNLQALMHYEGYALTLSTIPYSDLHSALPTTLIEPVEPISHLIRAGIHGSATLPPFPLAPNPPAPNPGGLPINVIVNGAAPANIITALNLPNNGAVAPKILHTGVLWSLTGNTVDLVRARMENGMEAAVKWVQKDLNEFHRFRVAHRFALRKKDLSAYVVFVFLDSLLPG
jgi:hypothetical protein